MIKRILVTGSTGLIGSTLVKKLIRQKDVEVVAASNSRLLDSNIECEKFCGDLVEREACDAAVENIDEVYHCAAMTSGGLSWNDPLVHVTKNIILNANLLEAAYREGVKKFLYLSSTTGYPDTGSRPTHEEEMQEGDPYDKYFCVGWMKRYTEKLCQMYSEKLERKMPCVVLRPTNVYGPGDKFDIQRCHVLPALINKICAGTEEIEVWGDGRDYRDMVFVDDMAKAMQLAMERVNGYNPINIGSGSVVSVNEMIKLVMYHTRLHPKVKYVTENRPRMIPIRRVNVDKAKFELGWEATTNFNDGVKKTIEWYKENYA